MYDRDDRVVSTLFGEDDDTTRTNEVYDGLGRITRRATYNGGTETRIEENYTYAAGYTGYSANATTDLITGISQSGMVQSYTYDVNGRIVSWTCNGKVCTYEYDGIGQLIRVNDEKDNRGGTDGTTWTYEYDNGGNITNRKKYAYTTGTVGTLLGTIPYAYGDTVWKDKLTSYNGTAITSDGIGNFTADGTWTYAWVGGRRLASMTKTGMSIAYLYDENGQRIKKSVTENGTTTVTDYTVCGKNVTHLHRGTDDLHIYYESGRLSHCKFNSSVYTYVYSLQGDVLGLKDSSGTLVVTYLYDAWGKEISRGGTLANTLGVINPFRYRGYVYDEETGLYYLRSRYYDPDIGRFISSDSILGQVGGLLQHNLFCYCGNETILNIDVDGYYADALYDDTGSNWVPLIGAACTIAAACVASRTEKSLTSSERKICHTYSVYFLADNNDIIKYVGRVTDNGYEDRMRYHQRTRGLIPKHRIHGLDYFTARGLEEIGMIYFHTIDKTNAQNNQIHGISIYNKNYKLYIRAAYDYLENRIEDEFLNIHDLDKIY